MWYIHPVGCYSVIKSNELLIHATTRINLENIVQVKRARHKKPHIILFHVYETFRIDKFIETEGRLGVSWA